MPNYRRNRVPGGTFFFTVNLLDRRSYLLVTEIDGLRAAVRQVRALAPFHIDAWAVLPDHMHCLWTLPQGDADFTGRWRAIKLAFVKSLPSAEPRSTVVTRRGDPPPLPPPQAGEGWEGAATGSTRSGTLATSPCIFGYIHFNPVKRSLVSHPADWPHSTFCRCLAAGLYPAGWIGNRGGPQHTGERQ